MGPDTSRPSGPEPLPGITVGILTKDGLARLRKCLPSVLRLDYPDLEILVVDYGSTDGSLEFLAGFPQIRVEALGGAFNLPRGRNTLVRAARQPFFFMCDNDIEVPQRDLLRHLMARYRGLERVAFLSPLVVDADTEWLNDVGLSLSRVQRPQRIERALGNGPVEVAGYYGNCVLFERARYAELGPSEECYPYHNDDYDLSAHAWLRGYRVVVDTDRHVIHHGRAARVEVQPASWRQRYYLCSMSRTVWKYYRARNVLLWWPLTAGWIAVKACRLAWASRSPRPLVAYLCSFGTFLRDLPETLRARRRIQRARRVRQDVFLRIPPAAFS